jgi:phytoene/squalene synthetase
LQLTNFWQDVPVDLDKGRIYLPLELLRLHHCPLDDVLARRCTAPFRNAMREAVTVAREEFHRGLPLIGMVDRRLALDLDLFSRGGLRMLDRIEMQGYDVFASRPVIGKWERARLLFAALGRMALRSAA